MECSLQLSRPGLWSWLRSLLVLKVKVNAMYRFVSLLQFLVNVLGLIRFSWTGRQWRMQSIFHENDFLNVQGNKYWQSSITETNIISSTLRIYLNPTGNIRNVLAEGWTFKKVFVSCSQIKVGMIFFSNSIQIWQKCCFECRFSATPSRHCQLDVIMTSICIVGMMLQPIIPVPRSWQRYSLADKNWR